MLALGGAIAGICIDDDLLALYIFVLCICLLLVILCAKTYSNIGKNSKLNNSLIDYDHDRDIIIVHTLSNKDVEIDPKDYIGIQRNYWSDFIVNFKFVADGRKLLLQLGFTEDIRYAREFLDKKLREKINNSK